MTLEDSVDKLLGLEIEIDRLEQELQKPREDHDETWRAFFASRVQDMKNEIQMINMKYDQNGNPINPNAKSYFNSEGWCRPTTE